MDLCFCTLPEPHAHTGVTMLIPRPERCSTCAGSQPQVERIDTITALRDFKLRVVVSTDLVARGIDLGALPQGLPVF